MDLVARKAEAAKDAQPFKDEAKENSQAAEELKDHVSALKKAKPKDADAIAEAQTQMKELNKAARAASAKAEAIENAVYDLKAVNPNRKPKVDKRTPVELLDVIEAKANEIEAAVKALRSRGAIRAEGGKEAVKS